MTNETLKGLDIIVVLLKGENWEGLEINYVYDQSLTDAEVAEFFAPQEVESIIRR
jgi:hypothetical protein